MTSGPHIHPLASPLTAPVHMPVPAARPEFALRLRLKPKAPLTGYVDGGWWPRSRDLAVELTSLAHVLEVRLGRVTRVAYPVSAWAGAPRQITVDGHAIRLEGFHSQDEHVLHLSGTDRQRISLLVVPPDTDDTSAHDAMMTSAHRGNAARPLQILISAGVLPADTMPRLRLVGDDEQSRFA